jgi:HEAT repeat protein
VLDRIVLILIQTAVGLGVAAILTFVLRESWLRWRTRHVQLRVQHLNELFEELEGDHRSVLRAVQKNPAIVRDIELLEHLLEQRRQGLEGAALAEHFASYDELGIVDRAIDRFRNSRRWPERVFAARFLGEIGSARGVEPLIEVMRNTREEDRDVRMAASRALGRIRDPRALPALVEALGLPESWLPARIAEVILQFGDACFDTLAQQLATSRDANTRAWAAEILGQLGSPRAVGTLLNALGDINDQVRARAAGALGKLQDRQSVPQLIHLMLSDPVPFVRIQSVRALGAIGDQRALHHLIDSLKDGEWWVRIRVIEALEQLGESAVEPLYLALEDTDTEVRARAAMTLERLGDLDRLLERAGEGDVAAREKLVVAGQAGVVEILIDALSHDSPRTRYAVAEILGEVSHAAVTAALIQRLTDEEAPPIRAEVVRALSNLRDETAAEPISHLLGDPHETIRVEAVRALERIPVADPNTLLASALTDPEPRVRAGAAVVLGKVGNDDSVQSLLPLLADCDESVRAEAARALGLLRATAAVPRLLEAFHDYDVEVQVASARALGQVGSPDCLETLVRGLENAGPELSDAIAWALGQIQWSDPERVIDVLFQGADRASRLGALDVLAQIGHDASRELIRSMLEDSDEEVVLAAVASLGKLGDPQSARELHRMMRSPSEEVRMQTLDALCRIDAPDSRPIIREALFDPSAEVRARSVLVLGCLQDAASGDVLRGVLASDRSSHDMQAYALLALMALNREQDLTTILESLEEFPLVEFLNSRERRDDDLLARLVESIKTTRSIEFMIASPRPRREIEEELRSMLSMAQDEELRIKVIRTLSYMRSESAYPVVWRTFHKDPSENVRVEALHFLAKHAPGEEFFKLLMDGMQDLQVRVRSESLRLLKNVTVEEALPLVLANIESDDEAVQEALVEFLAAQSANGLEQFLDGVLGSRLGVRGNQLLVRLLGRTRYKGAGALLESFLESDEPELRRSAATVLSRLPASRARRLLEACLQDPDLEVRLHSVESAAHLGAARAEPVLRAALEDPAAEVRRLALLNLARLIPRKCTEDFQRATRDAEPTVRSAALAALLVEGTQRVEDWVGPQDVPVLARALSELYRVEEFERILAASRVVAERVGALKALFFHDANSRARALRKARLDPSRRVQSTGVRLEEMLQVWLRDDKAAAWLGATAEERESREAAENGGAIVSLVGRGRGVSGPPTQDDGGD